MDRQIFHMSEILNLAFGAFLTMLLLFSVAVCQKPLSKNAQDLIVWQQRVDGLTDGVLNDSKAVGDSERAMYLALLAKITWKSDPDEARGYLKKAASLMLGDLDSGEKKDLAKKLKYSQKTIQIIAGLDEKLSQSLIGDIDKSVGGDDDENKKENPEMADLFAKLGLQVVETNPAMALACGFDSLMFGMSRDLPKLIAELHSYDQKQGEMLFRRSIASARGNYTIPSYAFVSTFGYYVFATLRGKVFSDDIRRSYLEVLADLVSGAASVEAERPNRCSIAVDAPRQLKWIDEYLPSISATYRQNIQICIPYTHPFTQEYAKAEAAGEEPVTTDDCIRAARNTSDPALKGHYLYLAITKFEKAKKFDDIISMLDDMTEDEVKAIGTEGWDYRRGEYGYQAVMAYIETKDLPAVYRIINKTPKKNRSWVRFRLVFTLSPVEYHDFILETLEELRKEVGAIDVPAKETAGDCLSLAGLYLKFQPTESEELFREAVKYINKTDNDNPDFVWEKDYSPLNDYIKLSSGLLEADEFSINSSLNNISSRRSRVRLKLGLLESSLQKLAEVKKKVEEENKKTTKAK